MPIEWAVTGGGGSISPAQDVTADSHGVGYAISSAVLTLGPDEGIHTATATAPTLPGAPKVTFTATAVTVMVEVRDSEDGGFVPKLVTVPPGKSVAWVYSSEQERLHNVTFEDEPTQPVSSRVLWLAGMSHVRTFGATPPLIRYRCTYHSTGFTDGEVGTITVEDPSKIVVLVPYEAGGYRYKIVDSTVSGGGFELPGFDDTAAGFAGGEAPFGTLGSDYGCPLDSTVRTNWPVETDLLLRKTFELPSGADQVKVRVAIDDDVQVFVNGVDVSASGLPNSLQGGFQRHEGCAERDSFVFPVPDGILRAGSNLLAVRARDRGEISHVDLRVTAERN